MCWRVLFRLGFLLLAFFMLTGIRGAGPGWGILIGGCAHLVTTGELPLQTAARERLELLARAQAGNAEAQHRIGHQELLIERIDSESGRRWLCRAAKQGYAPSQFMLGKFYADDYDSVWWFVDTPEDYAQAYKWLTLAARQAHVTGKQDINNAAARRLRKLLSTMKPEDKARGERLLRNWREGPCGPAMPPG